MRAGLQAGPRRPQEVNAYLNATEPWQTAKTDRERTATTLWTALQAISGCNLAFAPFTPFAAAKVSAWLGHDEELRGTGWQRREVVAGTTLGEPTPLFRKVELPEDEPAT